MSNRSLSELPQARFSPRLAGFCILALFSLMFTLPMLAQTPNSPPTSETKASPGNTLLSLSLNLLNVTDSLYNDLGKQSQQASDIASSSDELQKRADKSASDSELYQRQAQAFETELKEIAQQFELSDADLSRLPSLLDNYRQAVETRSADQQTAIDDARKQRDAAMLKASRWWIWLLAGIGAGIATDRGGRALGWW